MLSLWEAGRTDAGIHHSRLLPPFLPLETQVDVFLLCRSLSHILAQKFSVAMHPSQELQISANDVSSGVPTKLVRVTSSEERADEQLPFLQRSARSGTHLKDLVLLSLSFLLVFLAYGATQNLESSLNSDEGLGSVSLGVLYLSLTVCSVGAPSLVRSLGSKYGILLGFSGYWVFIVANLFPSWYTMMPASLFLGFAAALLWVAEGTYITCAAKRYASEFELAEESTLGRFNGVFWGIYACHQVVGNLLSFVVLQSGQDGNTISTGISSTTWLLLVIFLGCMLVGNGLACFLSSQAGLSKENRTSPKPLVSAGFVNATLVLLNDKKLLLLLPLLVYSGLQQGFIWGDFTEYIVAPALGISLIGAVMAAFGTADAACSLVAGRLSTGVSSISVIISGGAVAQLLVLVRLIFKKSYESDLSGYLNLFGSAIIWGLGDAAFNTQISALLGILYPDHTEAAFAQWKIWQSLATAIILFATSYTLLSLRLTIMLIALLISLGCFLVLRLIFFRK